MKLTVKPNKITERLRDMASPQRRTAALRRAGQAVIAMLKLFWNRKDAAEPNSFFSAGSIRTHFWRQISNSVEAQPTIKNGVVTVMVRDTRIRQKINGGPIVPVRARALTIPTHPDAHGTRARDLEKQLGIKLFILRVRGEAFLAGKKGRSLVKYYLLSKGVNQAPWPRSIPEKASIVKRFRMALADYYKDWRLKKA